MPGRTAVLIVNGYAPRTRDGMLQAIRYPWIALCLRELIRRSRGEDYEIHVWDNAGLREHRAILAAMPEIQVWPEQAHPFQPLPHAVALDHLVASTGEYIDNILTLDTDALPLADGWLSTLTSRLEQGASLVGIWRDEMAPELSPFIHPSCLCIRRQELLDLGVRFSVHDRMEPGQNLTELLMSMGRTIVRLPRSNKVTPHFLIGGLYGDLVYHHGAGSRTAWFYASNDQVRDERVRVVVRDAVFDDFDHLVSVLRGEQANDIW